MYANLRTDDEIRADESAALQRWPADDIGASQRDPAAWPAGFGQGRFVDTIPTQPGHLDGAHACSDINCKADSDEPAPTLWQRFVRLFIKDFQGGAFL